jgi:DNA invertase Pin-like site-specific DNA recombinase
MRRKGCAKIHTMKIGYARVSTNDQNRSLQLDALQADGCEKVFQDTASGASSNRKRLADALDACACGDVLTVWKLDRLGRTLFDLVGLVEDLKTRGVGLKVLTGQGAAIDTTNAEGRMFFGMFAVLAEFERELIRERTTVGMKAAKRRGQHVGRPRKLTPQKLDAAARELAAGNSQRVVAGTLGVAVSTLREAMKRRAT